MTMKGDLDACLKRCLTVADNEIGLLRRWEADSGLEIGRKASCGGARRDIEEKRRDINEIVQRVNDLDEGAVARSPGQARRDEVSGLEKSVQARASSIGSKLDDEEFEDALLTAKENAGAAVVAAQGAFDDCTS